MKWKSQLLLLTLLLAGPMVFAGELGASASARHITLQEAVQLALQHNHNVHIAADNVEAKQHATEVAKSAYLPSVRNESTFMHLTDTQLIQLRAGSLGGVAGIPVRPADGSINRGAKCFTTSGPHLTHPLTTLLKTRSENDRPRADWKASQQKAKETVNDVALVVHQLYYQ